LLRQISISQFLDSLGLVGFFQAYSSKTPCNIGAVVAASTVKVGIGSMELVRCRLCLRADLEKRFGYRKRIVAKVGEVLDSSADGYDST
jgi:hypothetical protein